MKERRPEDMPDKADRIQVRVTEIYPAIIGESSMTGFPCTLIRLTGCSLRCRYCDTRYAVTGGRMTPIGEIVRAAQKFGHQKALVTGGEPLEQPDSIFLLRALVRARLEPVLETNGAQDLKPVPEHVHVVMDLKTPGSQMEKHNRMENLSHLSRKDEIKIVLMDKKDYQWAKGLIKAEDLAAKFSVTLSPAYGRLDPKALSEWILKDALPVRLGLQMHKYIHGPEARGV